MVRSAHDKGGGEGRGAPCRGLATRLTDGTDLAVVSILTRGREAGGRGRRGTGGLRGGVPGTLRPGAPVHRATRGHGPGRGPGGRAVRDSLPAAGRPPPPGGGPAGPGGRARPR